MIPEEQLSEVKLQVGLLNKDIQHTNLLCDKLSESIEKIQEMNMNLVKMIALHDNKHEQHEKVEDNLKDDYKDLITIAESLPSNTLNTLKNLSFDKYEQVIKQQIPNISKESIKRSREILEAML